MKKIAVKLSEVSPTKARVILNISSEMNIGALLSKAELNKLIIDCNQAIEELQKRRKEDN